MVFDEFWHGISLVTPTRFVSDSDFEGFGWVCEKCEKRFDFGLEKPDKLFVFYCPNCGRKINEYV